MIEHVVVGPRLEDRAPGEGRAPAHEHLDQEVDLSLPVRDADDQEEHDEVAEQERQVFRNL